jgi:hypothetical protein
MSGVVEKAENVDKMLGEALKLVREQRRPAVLEVRLKTIQVTNGNTCTIEAMTLVRS